MSILANDPYTQLAFSIYENPGVFAVLLGSGLSRSAEIPTGWEITLDLIRRVALSQGVEPQPDWANWYRKKTGQEPNYSALLEELTSSSDERRSILHSYIEPTEQEREEGKKVPTPAHRALANLVRTGYVRVIVTTNFDRLMENALRECGVEPTIVASVDALKGVEPIAHSSCYTLKLHGDYKDARIRNTDGELRSYPAEYDALLDRIFDEYGLIVCGWSGEWDHALRAALLRAPNRRYPMYWGSRGKPGNGAEEIIAHRGARIIEITDADSFFTGIWQRVQTLEQTHRQNPLSVELLINSTKRYLAKAEHRIQLDELFAEEVERLIGQINSSVFMADGSWSQDDFRNRVSLYEAATEPLARMAGILGRWGDDSELPLILDILRAIRAHADKVGSGLTVWLNIRSYPAVLVFTAYGLGLVRSRRWNILHSLLASKIAREHHDPERIVETLFLWAWQGGENDYWKHLEGLAQRKTALSDHLLDVFQDWGKSFVGIAAHFEQLFEQFEILASIAYIESTPFPELEQVLADQTGQKRVWLPIGRSGWNRSVREKVLLEILSDEIKAALLGAGYCHGSAEFFEQAVANYRRNARRMEW